MNLAQVIHQRWAADETLNGLLPASRVYTGLSFDPARPFGVISKESDKPESYHSDGSAIDAVGLRIQVFHDHYDAGAEILHQIKTVFDRTAFDLAGSDKVLNIRRSNDWERQNSDGAWQFVVDFSCTVYLASGV
jgi:hypothetical protein